MGEAPVFLFDAPDASQACQPACSSAASDKRACPTCWKDGGELVSVISDEMVGGRGGQSRAMTVQTQDLGFPACSSVPSPNPDCRRGFV